MVESLSRVVIVGRLKMRSQNFAIEANSRRWFCTTPCFAKGANDDRRDPEAHPVGVDLGRWDVIVESTVVIPCQYDHRMLPEGGIADGVDDGVGPLLPGADAAQRRVFAIVIVGFEDRHMTTPAFGEILGQAAVEVRRFNEARVVIRKRMNHVDIAHAGFVIQDEVRNGGQ